MLARLCRLGSHFLSCRSRLFYYSRGIQSSQPGNMNNGSEIPVVFIVGTTGVGKSDLGIALAKRFNGEIINADAMQMYKGLDILTNKVTEEEVQGVPHHLMSFLEIDQEYDVGAFVDAATRKIDELLARRVMPIVVGGTNYYVQSLLWTDCLIQERENDGEEHLRDTSEMTPHLLKIRAALAADSTSGDGELWRLLQEVDPVSAEKWHERDERKIRRSLEIYLRTGKPQSTMIQEQIPKPRWPRPVVFWVHAQFDTLDCRLERRAKRMVERGIFTEIQQLWSMTKLSIPSMSAGIFQVIGFKEFLPYLQTQDGGDDCARMLEQIKVKCLATFLSKTKRYARKQVSWIRNKFVPLCRSTGVSLCQFDSSDATLWKTNVEAAATSLLTNYLTTNDHKIFDQESNVSLSAILATISDKSTWTKRFCDVCQKQCNGPTEWVQHLKSKRHRALKRKYPVDGIVK